MKSNLRLRLAVVLLLASSPGLQAGQDLSGPGQDPPAVQTPDELVGPAEPEGDERQLGPVLMLRLRDGSIRWGRIEGHDPEQLRFVLLDTGGLAGLPWGLLDPLQEKELRLRFGYVDATDDEILIDADRLLLIDGTEVIGKIVNRTQDSILVKTSNAVIAIPKIRVGGASAVVQVPALDIYSKEELYGQQLIAVAPEDAQAQFELAQFCERILDFAHAFEHYGKVVELAPDFRVDDVRAALGRTEVKAQRQEEIDYLSDIEHLRKRKKYDAAMLLVEAFPERYPDSPLFEELQKKRRRIERSVQKDLEEQVVRRWHFWAGRLSRKASRLETFAEVLGYIEEAMPEEVLSMVHKDMQKITSVIEPEEVLEIWTARGGGRWRKASYGYGTWLLGEDEALKGQKVKEPEDKPQTTALQRERDELEKKIKRFYENQEKVRKARNRDAQGEDYDAFWQTFSGPSRTQWILAYYAEHGGHLSAHERPLFHACRECGGSGVRDIINLGSARSGSTGSSRALVPCPACHRIGVVRRIRYR